jgi:Flp pilus assembly protein TadD
MILIQTRSGHMSRAKTPLAALALALASVSACASAPDPEAQAAAQVREAMEAAMQPATQEEIDAANHSDPLTKANFWSKEYAKDAENIDNALTFADALRGIGSTERAIEVLSEVLVLKPNEPRILMPLGRALAANGNQLGAARAFEQTAMLEPDRAEAWAALGTAMDQLENHRGAQVAYDKALAIEPERASTLANYGLSLALTGDLPGAEAKLRQASAVAPGDARIRENLALVLGLQGRFDEMEKTSSGYAPDKVVEQNVELLKQMIEPDHAPDALETAAKISPPVTAEEAPPAEETGLRLKRSGD